MMKIDSAFNLAMGFIPYKAGNKIGWIKEDYINSRLKNVYQHLPSGTILKKYIDTKDGTIWHKSILKHDGTEIKSYLSNSHGGRKIYLRHPDKTGIIANTRYEYDSKTKKYINCVNKHAIIENKLYTVKEALKLRLGIK